MKPQQGLRLGGRYELRSRLAVGGMGEVWVTEDLSLQRSVAAKVLRPELAGDERFLADLRAEARTTAPLAHPNIAALYDYGEDPDGSGYLVMELVAGETLADVLGRERTLAVEALLPILAQAARALHAAHVAGVVHRDVKPSNILITPDGQVKITDFGISTGADSREERRERSRCTVLGTAHYLSPEQALGREATPASDVYALGVVAFEAASGRRPFDGDSLTDVAQAHVHQRVPALPEHLPDPIRDLISRMLEKHPQRRPRSAAAVARTLDRIARELELAHPFEEAPPSQAAEEGKPEEPPAATAALSPVGGRGPRRHPRHRSDTARWWTAWTWIVLAGVTINAPGSAAYRLTRTAAAATARVRRRRVEGFSW